MICHKISSIIVLLFGFVGLISCNFSQTYESICKVNPNVSSYMKDRNGLINSLTIKLYRYYAPNDYYIFKVKLDQQNGRIVLDKELTNREEDYSVKEIYRGFGYGFDPTNEHIINLFPTKQDTHFYFRTTEPQAGEPYFFVRIRKYDLNNTFIKPDYIIKRIITQSNKLNLTNKADETLHKEYPILKIIDTILNKTIIFKEIFKFFSYIESENKIYTLVLGHTQTNQTERFQMYDPNGQTSEELFWTALRIRSMIIQSVVRTNNLFNIRIYLSFSKVFALYEMVSTDQTVQSIDRKSTYRENRVWFGCGENLCLNSEINAITLSSDGKLLIFTTRFYWKWNKLEKYPQYKDSFLLKPHFRDIDSAFLDPKTSKVFVIKGYSLMEFNDNNDNNEIENVTQVFPGLQTKIQGKVDAIDYNFKSDEIQLFSNNIILIYKRQPNNSYTYKTEKRLGIDLNLPTNMDTVFTDENGDQIFVKNNNYFWKEYGIMSIHFLQRYLLCSDKFYESLGLIDEYKSLKEFEEDSNHRKLSPPERPIDRTYDIPTIAIPTTPTTKTPTYFLPTNFNPNVVSTSTTKPLTPIQISILIGFGFFAIILIVGFCLFWSCVYLKSENPEIKRQALRRKLDQMKQPKRKNRR